MGNGKSLRRKENEKKKFKRKKKVLQRKSFQGRDSGTCKNINLMKKFGKNERKKINEKVTRVLRGCF